MLWVSQDGLPGLALTTVLAWASYPPSLTSRCSGQVGQRPPPRARPQPGHSAPTHLLLGLLLGLGVHPAQLVQRLHKHCPHFIDELSDLGTASTGGAAGVWSEARAPLRASQRVAWGWGGWPRGWVSTAVLCPRGPRASPRTHTCIPSQAACSVGVWVADALLGAIGADGRGFRLPPLPRPDLVWWTPGEMCPHPLL